MEDKDAAARTRIINHMNADHQDSLIRYLRHYHHLSPFSARNATLTSIDYSALTIATSSNPASVSTYRIPLDPPLASWAEARPRLVQMDQETCSRLGCSPVTVKRYVSPSGLMAVNFTLCLWAYATFSRRAHFLPGNLYYKALFQYFPRFAGFCYKIQPWVFYLMIFIHFGEVAYLERSRLRKHTVRMFSNVWLAWMLSEVIEGVTATLRFDRLVKEEEEKRAKQKH